MAGGSPVVSQPISGGGYSLNPYWTRNTTAIMNEFGQNARNEYDRLQQDRQYNRTEGEKESEYAQDLKQQKLNDVRRMMMGLYNISGTQYPAETDLLRTNQAIGNPQAVQQAQDALQRQMTLGNTLYEKMITADPGLQEEGYTKPAQQEPIVPPLNPIGRGMRQYQNFNSTVPQQFGNPNHLFGY